MIKHANIKKNLKVPNFKFPKLKMEEISEIEEVKIESGKEKK